MFPEESNEVEKYVDGLPDMIQGNMMASKPKKMQDAIEFATELVDQKIHTLAERQAKNKKKAWGKETCATNCANYKRSGHLTRDCRSPAAAANNSQRAQGENQRVLTCFECGAQGLFKSNCPK
ncbi:putative reverse transcriptase domain-containing protein, partial [Tanacetum coccineum]